MLTVTRAPNSLCFQKHFSCVLPYSVLTNNSVIQVVLENFMDEKTKVQRFIPVYKVASSRARIRTWSVCIQMPCSYSFTFTWEKPFMSAVWHVVLLAFHRGKSGCWPELAAHSRWFTLGWNHWMQDRRTPVPDSAGFRAQFRHFLLALVALSKLSNLSNQSEPQFSPR